MGQSLGSQSQNFAFAGTLKLSVAWTEGCAYHDLVDFCRTPQGAGEEPGDISVRI